MKSKVAQTRNLEDELVRLNSLVRARRKQLARLDACPNKDCECRRVWREVVEEDLSKQVGSVRRKVKATPRKSPARKGRTAKNRKG